MSYTKKNTKNSPIKNTNMSHTSKTKLDYTPTPTKVYKITGFDIYDYDNAYGLENNTMLKRCNPKSGNCYYCQDTRKEILEYLLENEEDVEDGGKKATDYKLIEEELKPIKNNLNTKIDKKLVGMTVWMLDDTECNYGRFCWFDTVYEARKRFEERKGEWCSALIEFKGDAVFAIDRLPCPVCGENEFPSPKRDWCDKCEEERRAQAGKDQRKQKL